MNNVLKRLIREQREDSRSSRVVVRYSKKNYIPNDEISLLQHEYNLQHGLCLCQNMAAIGYACSRLCQREEQCREI